MTHTRIVSVWCLPCAEDARRYSDTIASLARMSSLPEFQPHLTLGSLTHREGLRGLAETGFSLDPIAIDGTPAFTTSLFIRFRLSDPLRRARAALEHRTAFRSGRTFDPHMSLHYGPPPADGAQLERVTALLHQPVLFDRLAAVEMDVPIEDHNAVQAWRVLETYSLPGP